MANSFHLIALIKKKKLSSRLDWFNMSALFVLVIVSLIVAVGFLTAFIWSVKNGQYDDDHSPSVRMLFDNKISDSKKDKL